MLKCSSVKFLIRVSYSYSCSCLTCSLILCIGSECRTAAWHLAHPSGVNPTLSFARRWRPSETMEWVVASFIFCFSLDVVFFLGQAQPCCSGLFWKPGSLLFIQRPEGFCFRLWFNSIARLWPLQLERLQSSVGFNNPTESLCNFLPESILPTFNWGIYTQLYFTVLAVSGSKSPIRLWDCLNSETCPWFQCHDTNSWKSWKIIFYQLF